MVTLKWALVFDKIPSLLHGCAVTMEISVLTLIFGTILGVILALMRDSHIKVIARLAQLYIWIWRGTPLMVQAFLIYFGLPNLGITLSAMTAGTLSMSLNTGAYIAEIVRSGIHAIDPAREVADRILFMEDGVIVEDAPPEEFFEHPKNERIRQFIRKVEKR